MPCQEASARPQSEAENVINAVSSYDKDAGGEMRRSVRWEKQGQARKRAFTEMLGVKKCRGISRVIGRCCNVRRRDLFPRHPSQFSASSARRLTWLGQAGYDDAGGDGGCGGCCVSEHVAAAPRPLSASKKETPTASPFVERLTRWRPRRSSSGGLAARVRSSSYQALRLLPPNIRSSSSISMGVIHPWPASSTSLGR